MSFVSRNLRKGRDGDEEAHVDRNRQPFSSGSGISLRSGTSNDFTDNRKDDDGNQTERIAAVLERTGRVFHRHRTYRCALHGARTAWHTHPLGQTLIVTFGCGWVQREGSPIEEIRPGDIVWFAPGEKHWHGASQTSAMSHIAIAESLDGKAVDWMEKVSDEQCAPALRSSGERK